MGWRVSLRRPAVKAGERDSSQTPRYSIRKRAGPWPTSTGRMRLTEHASVASFARFALQCLALGAPADIVAGAQRAGLEEIEHARLSFGLASAYSGNPERPLGIDVAGALEGPIDPCAVALSVAREGCIAETVSALLIAAARDAAEDPVVRGVLAEVAEQEIEHALLAWRYLRWALEHGDRQLRRAVAGVFARPELAVGLGATPSIGGSVQALRAHGCLPLAERQTIALQVVRNVVAPAARALLGSIAEATDSDLAAEVGQNSARLAVRYSPSISIAPLSTASSAGASSVTVRACFDPGGMSITLPGAK